jgi:TRAP-type uncharacterized transport system fused permease subunit
MLYKIGRLFQFVGLVLPPVAIAGNIAEKLTLWQSLSISAAGMLLFYLGWLLQHTVRSE